MADYIDRFVQGETTKMICDSSAVHQDEFEAAVTAIIEQYIVDSGITGRWTRHFTVSTPVASLSVDNGETYTYTATDIIDVYLNGLRLNPDEFTVTGSGSDLTIVLDEPTFVGDVEVVTLRLRSTT